MLNRKPVLINGVRIFIKKSDLDNYYAESYFLYKNHLNYLVKKIETFQLHKSNNKRQEYFDTLIEAYKQNAINVKKIVDQLKELVTLSSFENLRVNKTNNVQITLKDFIYLRRDWCYTKEGEYQLDLVLKTIKNKFSKIKYKNSSALFLGSGVGRIAFDCTDMYKKVYATDKSFSMVWHLQKLLNKESINFYNPQEKNVLKLENVAKKLTAKIPTKQLEKINSKFETFVSDVFDLPFKKKSINSIFSVYFTDVIALKIWFSKINEILSDDGLFIHFGPLDYFFSDEKEMLTAEEFRFFFEENGYKTLVDSVIETPHLEDSNSISYRIYRNWFFVAQKKRTLPRKQNINMDTVLSIKTPLLYERKGYLKEGINETDTILKLPEGNFEGADSVIKILELIDGKNTFQDILDNLKKQGFTNINSEDIKKLLINFLDQNILFTTNV